MEDVYLKFKIGVFYKDYDWMETVFARIIKDLGIDRADISDIGISLKQYPYHINIGDLVTIYFVKPDDTCIGYRFDRIYYQRGLNEEETAVMIASKSYMYPMALD